MEKYVVQAWMKNSKDKKIRTDSLAPSFELIASLNDEKVKKYSGVYSTRTLLASFQDIYASLNQYIVFK